MKRVVVVNQVFFPDEVAVSQYVSAFVFSSAKNGNDYTVVCGQRDWENPGLKYKAQECINNVKILRLGSSAFTKKSKFGRLINFITFQANLCLKLLFINKKLNDLVVCSTVPPMLPITTAFICKLKKMPFVYWVMDLQPDEAIAAGYLKEKGVFSKILQSISMFPLRYARSIIVLDRFMKEKLINKNIKESKISSIGLWPVIDMPEQNENSFRIEQGFGSKIVVMYSGNHSICHPLDTLLESANILRNDSRFLFVFIGSGVRKRNVTDFIKKNALENIVQLPYQPQNKIKQSLAAADIHIVVQGNEYTGLVHPSKVYGVFAVGKPFMFIGPEKSHIGDMIKESGCGVIVPHGDHFQCANAIASLAELKHDELERYRLKMHLYIKETYSEKNQISLLEKEINR